jgi:hypothetical protein
MYREGKNTQTNIEKEEKEEEEQQDNCKAKRQKIMENKYKERQHRQEIKK